MVDAGTLEAVLSHIHNWFERDSFTVGRCAIEGGELPASVSDRLLDGQWYRVEGSYLNDGLHLHPDTSLADETFDATITLLAIPKPLLNVAEEIGEWAAASRESDLKALSAPYQSESFGGYTYSAKATTRPNSGAGGLTGWKAAFAGDLNAWRKIS